MSDKLKDLTELLPAFRDELNNISPSFCAAKWQQVTIHLATGQTHSCHHPVSHKIPVEEVLANPSAIHNTNFKKQQRKMMQEGHRPEECDYCWRVEDSNSGSDTVFSDRITKSHDAWARPYLENISKRPWDDNVNPSYMEISFSNVCNFKCAYCSPEISSKWMEEYNQHGAYTGMVVHNYNDAGWLKQIDKFPIPEKDDNPYVDAFWAWWPEAVKDLRVFRITGGEPLLSKHTFRVLDYLIENPQPELELDINSNLCVPDGLMNNFINKMKTIQENKCVKLFKLYTSCEAHGAKAEYIRTGMDYNKWLENCDRVLGEIPNSYLTVMSTYNALSVTSMVDFMKDVVAIKNKHTVQPTRPHPVSIDIPYLRYPHFLAVWILTPDFLQRMEDTVTYMYQNLQQTYWLPLCGKGFFDYEINRMKRIYYVAKNEITEANNEEMILKSRIDFYRYITEHDRRRNTNFLETFPEYKELFELCKQASENYNG